MPNILAQSNATMYSANEKYFDIDANSIIRQNDSFDDYDSDHENDADDYDLDGNSIIRNSMIRMIISMTMMPLTMMLMILMAIAVYLASSVSSFDNSPHLKPGSLQPPSHNG